jgi:hypothetical protein
MDPNTPPLAPCYECGRLTHGRLGRTWFVDATYRDDDGQVLLPGTPVCDTSEHEHAEPCMRSLYSETTNAVALAAMIRYARRNPFAWAPLGGNGVTRPEPRVNV